MNGDLEGYNQGLVVAAPAVRVFALYATPRGIARWWGGAVTGSATVGRRLVLGGAAPGQCIALEVEQVEAGVLVLWRVVADTVHGDDWLGTRLRFRLSALDANTTMLEFRHVGLTPLLRGYSDCVNGWRERLARLESTATEGRRR